MKYKDKKIIMNGKKYEKNRELVNRKSEKALEDVKNYTWSVRVKNILNFK